MQHKGASIAKETVAFLLGLVMAAGFAGCSSARVQGEAPGVPALQKRVATPAEGLVFQLDVLDGHYGRLRAAANAYAFMDDGDQLDYLQKVALHVKMAHLVGSHQLALLQVLPRIRSSQIQDFSTLRHRDLADAIGELTYQGRFLVIYHPFIKHEQTAAEIEGAVAAITEIEDILRQLQEAFEPFVWKRRPERL